MVVPAVMLTVGLMVAYPVFFLITEALNVGEAGVFPPEALGFGNLDLATCPRASRLPRPPPVEKTENLRLDEPAFKTRIASDIGIRGQRTEVRRQRPEDRRQRWMPLLCLAVL